MYQNCTKGPHQRRKGLRLIDVNPFAARCRREDSNLHSLNGNQVLNLEGVPPGHIEFALEKHRKILENCDLHSVGAHTYIIDTLGSHGHVCYHFVTKFLVTDVTKQD